MPSTSTFSLRTILPELDGCHICGGHRGGVPGNGNLIEGVLVCDYCHARLPARPDGLVSASAVATFGFGLFEQLTFLGRALSNPASPVGTPSEIIGRMHELVRGLRSLPQVPHIPITASATRSGARRGPATPPRPLPTKTPEKIGKYWGLRNGRWCRLVVEVLPLAGGTGRLTYAPINKKKYPHSSCALRDCEIFVGPLRTWGSAPDVSKRAMLSAGASEFWLKDFVNSRKPLAKQTVPKVSAFRTKKALHDARAPTLSSLPVTKA